MRISALLLLATVALLTACSLEHDVSRFVVPGTALTVSIVEDEKSLYRCHVYIGSNVTPDSAEGIIVGHRLDRDKNTPLPLPKIVNTGTIAIVTWPGTDLKLNVSLKTGACRGL